jgi:hypothetical protein
LVSNTAARLLARMSEGDADLRGDLEAMVVNVRSDPFAAHADRVRVAALAGVGSLYATLRGKLKATGDADALAELRRRADGGDPHAASALGEVAGGSAA